MLLSSWGPGVASVCAQQVTGGKVSGISVVPQLGLVPSGVGAGLGTPSVLPLMASPSLSLSPSLAAPSLSAALQVTAPAAAVTAAAPVTVAAAKPVLPSVAVPSALEAVKPTAPGESFGAAAAEDFAQRITGEQLLNGNGLGADAGADVDATVSQTPRFAALSRRENGAPVNLREPAAPTKPEGEKRGVLFPAALAGLSGLAWGAVEFARWGTHALSAAQAAPSLGGTVLAIAAIGQLRRTSLSRASFLAASRSPPRQPERHNAVVRPR